MEKEIKEYLLNNGFGYVVIPDVHIIAIHNLLFKDIINALPNDVVLLYHGAYYRIKGDYDTMLKYYLMAIDQGSHHAIHNLIRHYSNYEDLQNIIKYHLMLIDCNDMSVVSGLADCYVKLYNYDNAVKYWLLGGKHTGASSINNLAMQFYYQSDYVNAVKYFSIAMENGNAHAIYNLGAYHYRILCDHTSGLKLWCQCVEHVDHSCVSLIRSYYIEHKLIHHGTIFMNKILNKLHHGEIIKFIMHLVSSLDMNMINIIVNMDHWQNYDVVFNEFKKLLV